MHITSDLGSASSLQVAYANTVGSLLLLRAAQKTGHDTFEGVAQAAGGTSLKVCSDAVGTNDPTQHEHRWLTICTPSYTFHE